jgi:predicted membrane-bound mannosyltransferase
MAGLTGKGLRNEHRGLVRFLTIYTTLVIIGYSLIPYKTPWCMLTFVHGAILLAGVGAVVLVRLMPLRSLTGLILAVLTAGIVHLAWQAWRLNHDRRFLADPRNPHVYAHTTPDALRLVDRVEELAAFHSTGHDMVIKVIMPDNYWPIPWYLRRFNHVGYWFEPPEDCDADVIMTGSSVGDDIDSRLKGHYQTGLYGLRYGVFMKLYVEQSLWDRFIAARSKPR